MPQCFWNPLLTDRDIWLGRRHTGRKGKHGCWNALLTSPLSFFLLVHSFYSFNVSTRPPYNWYKRGWADRRFLSPSSHDLSLLQSYSMEMQTLLSSIFFLIHFSPPPSSLISSDHTIIPLYLLSVFVFHSSHNAYSKQSVSPMYLAKCFLAAGWKACSTDLKISGYLLSDWLTWSAVCGF